MKIMNTYELALSLEEDMEKYYLDQADKHDESHLKQVFINLAKAERQHATLLTQNQDKLTAPVEDQDIVEEAGKLFKDIDDVKSLGKATPTQLDSYRKALDMEERSLKLYRDLQEKDPERKEIYKFLENEEDKHCIILEEIVKLTQRPEEWVESAEFGVREDY